MLARDLLNDLPDWLLAVIFVLGTVIVALVGFVLVRRFLPAWRAERSNQVIGGAAAMVMTMFALVLAFVIVDLYDGYNGAANNVTDESTSLTELVQDVRATPPPVRTKIERTVAQYAVEVRDHEFGKLRDGLDDPRAEQLLNQLFAALEIYSPVTNGQQALYTSAVGNLHAIVNERESRLDAAETRIPGPLLGLLILLAVLTLAMTLLIETHTLAVDVAIVVAVSVVLSAGLLTAVILQYPFSGSIAVKSDAYNSSVLTQLVQRYT
jgi:hypothetical protein